MALLGAALGGGGARLSATLLLNDQMSKGLLNAQRNVGAFETYMSNRFGPRVGESLTDVGRGLLSTGRAAVAFTGVLAVAGRSVAKFDKEIAGIAAVIGETSKDAVAPIRDQAIALSKEFAFSAQEIAEGQLFIAQAGGKLNDVLTATPEILNLATATMENFDLAAKLTIKTLNAFGDQISEVAEVRRVVNDLQFAVNNSVNTLQTLNDSLKFAAPFAHVLGIELEDLLSVFILTSNAGIEAGIAGRSLGQGLQQLVRSGMRGATEEAQQFAQQLSDVISSGGSLADITEEVEKRFGVLTGAEHEQIKALNEMSDAEIEAVENGHSLITVTGKLSELVQVFGVRGARIFGLVLGQSGKLREFAAAMDLQVVSAADQARVAMDNLSDQVQISLNKINAGILESDFGRVLGEQFEKLNESGRLDELGDSLGESLTELAETLVPLLVDSIETLVDLLDSAGPGLALTFETIATVVKTLNGVLELLPDGLRSVVIAAVLLNKTLGLSPLIARRLGLAMKQVALDGVNAFSTLTFQLKKLEIEQKAARSEVIAFGIQHRISGSIVRKELAAIDAQYARLIATQKRAAASGKFIAGGAKVLGGALAVGTVAASLSAERQELSSTEIGTDALTAGLTAGIAAGAIGTPVAGVAVGLGTALLVGLTDYFKSEKAKKESKKVQDSLEDLIASEEFKSKLENLGSDIGSQISAAIELGIRSGTKDLVSEVESILNNPAFKEAIKLVKLSGGRLEFDPGLKSGTIFADIGDEDVFKSGGKNNVRSPFNAFGLIPGSIGKVNQTETAVFDNVKLKNLFNSLGVGEIQGAGDVGVDTEQELEAALNGLSAKVLQLADVEQSQINATLSDIKSRALTSARATAKTQGVTELDAVTGKFTNEFQNLLDVNIERLKNEEGFIAEAPADILNRIATGLLAGTGLENIGQALIGQSLGKGFAATDFDVKIENGQFVLDTTFKDIDKSILDAAIEKGGLLPSGQGQDVLTATTFDLAEKTSNLGIQISTYQASLQNSLNAFLKLQTEVSELARVVADASLSVTKSKVSATGGLAEFLAKNGEALGLDNTQLQVAQDNLVKVKALQEIIALKEFQFQVNDLTIKQELQANELRLANINLELQRKQVQADLNILKEKLLMTDVYNIILENLIKSSEANLTKQQLTTIKGNLDALKHIRTEYDKIINAQDGIAAIIEKFGVEQSRVQVLITKQVANITDMNTFITELSASLGVNLNALSAIEKTTFFAWAKSLIAAEQAAQLNDRIVDMLRGAEGLGNALIDSEQAFVELGFSAKEVDEAISQFKKVQFLNSMLGFLNNFKELASSTGSNLNLNDTIVKIQTRILAAGDGFLKELLDITDPETFADILSRQNFLEQNVTKTTQINLEANLIFPEGITLDQREEISQVAIEAVAQALNSSPLLD